MFKAYDTKIVITESKPDKSAQEELVDDMVSLLASFSGKLDGMKSSRRKQLAKHAKEIIEETETEKGDAGYGKEEDKRDGSLSEGISF